MRKICPNCREIIGSNQMFCSGACRKEYYGRKEYYESDEVEDTSTPEEQKGHDKPLTPEEQKGHGELVAIVAIVVALWFVVGVVNWVVDILGCLGVICIVPALWFGFLFVRWFLKWLAKLV